MTTLTASNLPSLKLRARGKVRDIYDIDDQIYVDCDNGQTFSFRCNFA